MLRLVMLRLVMLKATRRDNSTVALIRATLAAVLLDLTTKLLSLRDNNTSPGIFRAVHGFELPHFLPSGTGKRGLRHAPSAGAPLSEFDDYPSGWQIGNRTRGRRTRHPAIQP